MLLLILWKFEKSRLPRFFFFFYSSVSLFLSLFLVFLAYVYCLWDVYIKKYESFHFIYLEVDTQETEAVFLSFFFYSVLYLFLCSFLFFSSFFFLHENYCWRTWLSYFFFFFNLLRDSKYLSVNLFFSVNSTFYDNVWINKIKSIRSKNLSFVFWMAEKRNNWFILPKQKTNFFFFLKWTFCQSFIKYLSIII